MKAAEVVAKQQAVVRASDGVELALRDLVSMFPEVEGPDGKKHRSISPDAIDSVRAIARGLKMIKLDALVVSQEVMNQSEEAVEAALKAQEGRFKIVDGPTPPEAKDGGE